ncbi:MAG: FtsK/SpoIIIE domain-containing protein [Acidimicrobiales bacterium]
MAELERCGETLAAAFGVASVRVVRHRSYANLAEVTALRSDPLASAAPAWPWLGRPSTSAWEPIPIGVDESGAEVSVGLAEHSLLLGGEPGAGKSAALSLLVGGVALDPRASMWLLDPKVVELSGWRSCARAFAGLDMAEAIGILREVQRVMDARYAQLVASGLRKLPVGEGLHVVVIDELAHYLTRSDKKSKEAFIDVLRDLVSRGRAAGVIVIAATQKPASDVVPTSLRDLFG